MDSWEGDDGLWVIDRHSREPDLSDPVISGRTHDRRTVTRRKTHRGKIISLLPSSVTVISPPFVIYLVSRPYPESVGLSTSEKKPLGFWER